MSYTLMPLPVLQFFTLDGTAPLAGGLLYTYQPGTSVPMATYTDDTGSVANPNPVVLDVYGRCTVWLNGTYDMILTDALGNVIWPRKTVVSGDQLQFTSLSVQIAGLSATIAQYAPLLSPIFNGTPQAPTRVASLSDNTIATTAFVHSVVDGNITSQSFPGMVSFFAMNIPPVGWLECDGSAVSRTTYVNLFTAIGVLYGSGNGASTFNLPDLRGVFVRGYDHSAGVDPARVFGTKQLDDFKSHAHTQVLSSTGTYTGAAGTTFGITSSSTGSTGGTETRPVNIALLPCIKY